jgi:uncharacterized protein (TIGR01777 family)
METKRRIVIAGGSGFLGQLLAEHFGGSVEEALISPVNKSEPPYVGRCEVVVLSRQPRSAGDPARHVHWDGATLGDWAQELEGAHAVINLAGRTVDCRYTPQNRRLIMDSRVHSTRVLGAAIAKCARPPKVWLNSSTATIYRHTHGSAWDELGEIGATPEAKDEFSVEVARTWETTFFDAAAPTTRKVALRSAMVLGNCPNSVFPVLRRLARFGLGGRMGDGRQFVSWVHADDFCRAVGWLLDREEFTGPVNVAAPNPLTNGEMMALFRRVCGAPFGVGLPATRWMLELGAFFLRTETELILKSRRVIPALLERSGFAFGYPTMAAAVRQLAALH